MMKPTPKKIVKRSRPVVKDDQPGRENFPEDSLILGNKPDRSVYLTAALRIFKQKGTITVIGFYRYKGESMNLSIMHMIHEYLINSGATTCLIVLEPTHIKASYSK